MPGNGLGAHELSNLKGSADHVRGSAPWANVSMTVMEPPQHRQRRAVASFFSSTEDGARRCEFSSRGSSSARILSMLAARTALRDRQLELFDAARAAENGEL